MNCPCCSGKQYAECCEPYHKSEKPAPNAEALRGARDGADAIPNGAYLMKTTLPTMRPFHSKEEMHEWGEINQWIQLEIISKPTASKVEFKAHYIDEDGEKQVHHELSNFKKIQSNWFYVDGEFYES